MELSSKVTSDLEEIAEKKKEEVEGEENFQAKVGAVRTPSQVCAALWKDATNYQTYHNQAVSHSAPVHLSPPNPPNFPPP